MNKCQQLQLSCCLVGHFFLLKVNDISFYVCSCITNKKSLIIVAILVIDISIHKKGKDQQIRNERRKAK